MICSACKLKPGDVILMIAGVGGPHQWRLRINYNGDLPATVISVADHNDLSHHVQVQLLSQGALREHTWHDLVMFRRV